jgi:hypothetical protein
MLCYKRASENCIAKDNSNSDVSLSNVTNELQSQTLDVSVLIRNRLLKFRSKGISAALLMNGSVRNVEGISCLGNHRDSLNFIPTVDMATVDILEKKIISIL